MRPGSLDSNLVILRKEMVSVCSWVREKNRLDRAFRHQVAEEGTSLEIYGDLWEERIVSGALRCIY